MADPYFAYPDSSSPTVSFTFILGAQLARDPNTYTPNQIRKKTMGGSTMVAELGNGARIYQFTARVYSGTGDNTVGSLIDFIKNTVHGSLYSFDWVDENGTARTVRLVNDDFTPQYFTHEIETVTLYLEEV